MSNTDLSPSWHRLAGRLLGADEASLLPGISSAGDPFPGRHSNRAEIAAETPIFHDLTLGRRPLGRRDPGVAGRIPAPRADPLTEFRRNPLTAPIPIQVNSEPVVPLGPQTRRTMLAPAISLVTSSGAHARPEQPRRHGRHHRPGPAGTP